VELSHFTGLAPNDDMEEYLRPCPLPVRRIGRRPRWRSEPQFCTSAGAERDQGLLAECVALYHPEVHMTSSLVGVTVPTRGRDELCRVVVEAMSDNRRYRHLNTEVVVDEGDRAVLRTTLLVLQSDSPLVAVPLSGR
jgi:hypothetical protein